MLFYMVGLNQTLFSGEFLTKIRTVGKAIIQGQQISVKICR